MTKDETTNPNKKTTSEDKTMPTKQNETTRRRRRPAPVGLGRRRLGEDLITETEAAGDDRRWAEEVLPLVAEMMRWRGYAALRLEILPGKFRYEVTQVISEDGKEGGRR
jgi:hypothetical protein